MATLNRRTLLAILPACLLAACEPAPNIEEVTPDEGAFVAGGMVTLSGSYVGVEPSDAVVLLDGAPALVSGKTFSGDVALSPGASAIDVELFDASDATVHAKLRRALIRGASLPGWEFVENGIGLRIQESFLNAMPMSELADGATCTWPPPMERRPSTGWGTGRIRPGRASRSG